MSAIRGEIQLVIGLVVAIVSMFNESLRIFVYVGAIIAVYGLIKVFYRLATKSKEVKHVSHAHTQHPAHQSQQQHPHSQHYRQQQYNPHSVVHKPQSSHGGANPLVKKCPSCQSVMPATYRHCPSCGFSF